MRRRDFRPSVGHLEGRGLCDGGMFGGPIQPVIDWLAHTPQPVLPEPSPADDPNYPNIPGPPLDPYDPTMTAFYGGVEATPWIPDWYDPSNPNLGPVDYVPTGLIIS